MNNKKEFNKMNHPTVKATVGAILIKDNKILLTKRAPNLLEGGKWSLPGGHIDIGETALKAVKREIKEETGLDFLEPKFFNYFDEFMPNLRVHSIVLIFYGEPAGKENKNEEVSEQKWFTQKEAEKLEFAFIHKKIIENFFKEGR